MIREVIETIRPDQPFDAMRSVRVIVSPDLMDTDNIKVQDKNVTIEENGLTVVTPDTGYQGLGEVQITTNVPVPNLQLYKSVTVNENKLTVIEPDQGYTGMRQVQVTTNIQSEVNNQSKNVTIDTNGFQQIVPDQGYSGIGEINLTVDVPTPVIQNDSIRYIEASNEARQVIVRPDTGFDALEKVTLNIASATLARDQNILTLNSSGIFNLPSVANSNVLGFADSCTVTVNGDINKVGYRYLSLAYGNPVPPAALIDLESDTFTGSTTNDIDLTLPEGRAICIITLSGSGKVFTVQFVGNPTGTGDSGVITVSKNKYYKEINYDIGERVFIRSSDNVPILSIGTHNIPNKIFLETDRFDFNVDYLYSPVVNLITV